MKFEKLAYLVKELESGSRPKGGVSDETGTIPSLGAEHIAEHGGIDFTKKKFVTTEFYNKLKSGKVKCKDILIVKDGATTGKVAFVEELPFENAAINEHVFRIAVDNNKAYPKFVYIYLRSEEGKRQILGDFRGATIGGISRQFVDLVKIPLPPLEDQIRIATVLTRVEALIAIRKKSIEALDELLKSIFVEMFGDPVKNEKQWELKTAIDYADCIVPGRDKPKNFTGLIPWITTDDLVHLGFTEKSKINLGLSDYEIKEVRARIIPKGSVIITCVGELGISSIAKRDMIVNQQLHTFQCKNIINSIFFMHAISYQKSFMIKRATKTTVPYMNKTVCNSIPMIKPPLDLQNQFAEIAEKVEGIKAKYQSSLTELENLYGSLSQRAFKGELDLSKTPIIRETEVEIREIETMESADMEVKPELDFSKQDLVELIKKYSGKIFSFEELWNEINTITDKKVPSKNDVQTQIIELLESDSGNLQQVFDIVTSQVNNKNSEKQIAFRGNYEN